MSKKTTLLPICLLLACKLSGCVKESAPEPSDTLVWALPNLVTNYYLKESLQKNVWNFNLLFAQSLYLRDPQGRLIPNLAKSAPIIGEKEIKVFIKEGVKFHDASALGCDDILWTYKDASHKGSPYYKTFQSIISLECIDLELRIQFDPKAFSLVQRLLDSISIYKKEYFPQNSSQPIGTGPFMFSHSDSHTSSWRKFEQYKGPIKTQFNQLVFRYIPDFKSRLEALEINKVDILPEWNEELHHLHKAKKQVRLHSAAATSITVLGFNKKSKSCISSKNNIEAMAAKLSANQTLLKDFFDVEYIKFNQSGSKDTNCSDNKVYFLKGSYGAQSLKRIEKQLSIDLIPRETAVFYSDLSEGKYNAFVMNLSIFPHKAKIFEYLHSSQFPPQKNRFFYASEDTDRELEGLLILKNEHDISEKLHKVFISLQNSPPFLFIGKPKTQIPTHKRIKKLKTKYQHTWLNALEAVKIN